MVDVSRFSAQDGGNTLGQPPPTEALEENQNKALVALIAKNTNFDSDELRKKLEQIKI